MKKIILFIGIIFVFTSLSYAESRVIIFNDSSWFKSPGKTTIEIKIDGKYIGKLQRGQYLETPLSIGLHEIAVCHSELFIEVYYEDIYIVNIHSETIYLKVFTGFTSTNVEVDEELAFFEKKYEKIKRYRSEK